MKLRPIFNLEFPSWCPELNIYGYCFTRVDNYRENFLSLQHLGSITSEFAVEPNIGTHSQTAFVELPKSREKSAILGWEGNNNTALMDILLLLSLFTGRDVFALKQQNNKKELRLGREVIIADPRIYGWGGILRVSIPYKAQSIKPAPFRYDIGFEESINKIYKLIRSSKWQKEYNGGYFLFLARTAFRRQSLESSFIQCWTIWEHLFAILNGKWLSSRQIQNISAVEKISFVLVRFALAGEIDNDSRKKIETLAEIRNRLIHYGKFPERGSVYEDAVLFIRLTEFVIAQILGLSPANLFNTIENLEKFLGKIKKP